ncbi:hypothetical protein [Micromonospora sp. KC213]|uniref:hypothetical protein n=1 Tax=Micromonospora sp. KC213 TaxID=2530378 RepID=UPI001FB74F8D|nr:hypothetical protein [Micromonospora sp. KC213]
MASCGNRAKARAHAARQAAAFGVTELTWPGLSGIDSTLGVSVPVDTPIRGSP